MMRFFFLVVLFITSTLAAHSPDRSSRSFEMREKKKVDTFDFSGEFPNLETIDIDGRRKHRVEFLMTGELPELTEVEYLGGFGTFDGKLTGSFPKLELVNFMCTTAAMNLDLERTWERDCVVNIRTAGDLVLKLPQDVGVVVYVNKTPTGKITNTSLVKKGLGWLNKVYENRAHQAGVPVTLQINLEMANGHVTFR